LYASIGSLTTSRNFTFLVSGVFFFHARQMGCCSENPNFTGPDL
jgi:hypothetical protein